MLATYGMLLLIGGLGANSISNANIVHPAQPVMLGNGVRMTWLPPFPHGTITALNTCPANYEEIRVAQGQWVKISALRQQTISGTDKPKKNDDGSGASSVAVSTALVVGSTLATVAMSFL